MYSGGARSCRIIDKILHGLFAKLSEKSINTYSTLAAYRTPRNRDQYARFCLTCGVDPLQNVVKMITDEKCTYMPAKLIILKASVIQTA
jgi:hypothetical protein